MTPYYDADGVTIWHGDALEVLPTLGYFDLAIVDPPYNVGKGYDGYGDDLAPEDYELWLARLLTNCRAATLTWFPGALSALRLLPVLDRTRWGFQRMLAWHKKEYAGDVFHSGPAMCWEPIVWATERQGERFHNKVFGAWGRDLLTVAATHGDTRRDLHPCPKPPEVMRWLLGLFCPPGGTVIDPTMGTGTTLVEAKYRGLRAVGIEQSERYCEQAANLLTQQVLDFGGAA